MKLKSVLKFVATPAAVFSTLIIMLLIVLLVQAIAWGLSTTFINDMFERHPVKVKAQDPNQRIPNSIKAFLSDGTIHLISIVEQKGRQETWRERIYDVNDKLLLLRVFYSRCSCDQIAGIFLSAVQQWSAIWE